MASTRGGRAGAGRGWRWFRQPGGLLDRSPGGEGVVAHAADHTPLVTQLRCPHQHGGQGVDDLLQAAFAARGQGHRCRPGCADRAVEVGEPLADVGGTADQVVGAHGQQARGDEGGGLDTDRVEAAGQGLGRGPGDDWGRSQRFA